MCELINGKNIEYALTICCASWKLIIFYKSRAVTVFISVSILVEHIAYEKFLFSMIEKIGFLVRFKTCGLIYTDDFLSGPIW